MHAASKPEKNKFTKTPILGFKVVQGHRCWYPLKARQQYLLWCAESLCLSSCNRSRARLVHCGKPRVLRGYPTWCPRTVNSLNLGGRTLHVRWSLHV